MLGNDYSSAADRIDSKKEVLCSYQIKIADFYNTPIGAVKKLVPNFFDKEKYCLHYENLQLYLSLGLKLKQIHHALEFNQSPWLKPHVKFNTKMKRSRN